MTSRSEHYWAASTAGFELFTNGRAYGGVCHCPAPNKKQREVSKGLSDGPQVSVTAWLPVPSPIAPPFFSSPPQLTPSLRVPNVPGPSWFPGCAFLLVNPFQP